MKKKLKYEDLPLEVKKDIFKQILDIKEHQSDTAKRYNITEKTLNKIVQEFVFEKIDETSDGIVDITDENELY